jgi:HEAT repeat protein
MAALAPAGCEDIIDRTPSRNFNELIPRFMGASNRAATPEEAAANLFNTTSPDERRDAIAYLQTKPYGHEPPNMKAYQVLTTDPHPMVRAQAMAALGTSRQPDAVEYLVKGLNDAQPLVRRDAALGLATTFGDAAVEPLIVHIRADVDEQVRLNCARALKNARTPEAVRALIDGIDDRDAAVAFYARASLVAATGQDYGIDPKAWLTWYQQTYTPTTAPAVSAPGAR